VGVASTESAQQRESPGWLVGLQCCLFLDLFWCCCKSSPCDHLGVLLCRAGTACWRMPFVVRESEHGHYTLHARLAMSMVTTSSSSPCPLARSLFKTPSCCWCEVEANSVLKQACHSHTPELPPVRLAVAVVCIRSLPRPNPNSACLNYYFRPSLRRNSHAIIKSKKHLPGAAAAFCRNLLLCLASTELSSSTRSPVAASAGAAEQHPNATPTASTD
jgi:hypothetical protein